MYNNQPNAKTAFDNLKVWGINQPQQLPAGVPTKPSTRPAPKPTVPPPTAVSKYPLPPGKGGYVVHNFYGNDMTFTINNHQYTVPGNGEQFIVLDPGQYPWSAFIPGKGQAHGTVTVEAGKLSGIRFSD